MELSREPLPVQDLEVGDKFYSVSGRIYEVLAINPDHRAEYAASLEVREDNYTSRPKTIAFPTGARVRLHSVRR